MRSVACQYLVMFAGDSFESFDVQEVLSASLVVDAVRGSEVAQQIIVAQLLRTDKRQEIFRRIDPDLDWKAIWRNRSRIIMKEWDV